MKKLLSVVLLLSVLLSGCGVSDDYINALPQDAAAIAVVNLSSLGNKSGLNSAQGTAAKGRLKEMVKSGLEGADGLIDRIFENANESGLDFKANSYVFAGKNMSTHGVVAKINSKGKFEDLIEMLHNEGVCSALNEQDGCQWTTMGRWLIAYNDNTMLTLTDVKEEDATRLTRRASMLLRQEPDESFAAKPDYMELASSTDDIALWCSLELLPREMVTPITMGISGELNLNEIKAIVRANFEQGKTTFDLKSLVNNKVMDRLNQQLKQAINPLKGKYAELFPANTPLWISANINGQELYKLICSNPTLRHSMDGSIIPVNFEAVLGAIKGDCALAITNFRNRSFILSGDVTGKDFLKTFDSLKSLASLTNGQMSLQSIGQDEYLFFTKDASSIQLGYGAAFLWFGVKNNRFYLTNDRDLIDRRVLGLSLADKPSGKDIAGNDFYTILNINAIKTGESYQAFAYMIGKKWAILLNHLDYLTISHQENASTRVELIMTDKNKNMLNEIINMNF